VKRLNLIQGTPEWSAARAKYPCASEAPVMMGASRNMTRSELLRLKALGLEREFSDYVQRQVLDKGHAVEGPARAITEQQLGEKLYPITAVDDADEYLASLDGCTMAEDWIQEHKQWSEELAAAIRAGATEFPDGQEWQLEHQLLVAEDAEGVIFVCSDGSEQRRVQMVYRRVPGRAQQLRAGWAQFEKDRAAYVPPAAEAPKPIGRAPESLPALRIEITGAVTASNLAEFKETALGAIRSVNRELTTDDHFADAEQAVKWCGEVESRIKAAKEHALSQTATIEALFRTLDDVSAEARRVRLDLEKLVERRKVEIKGELVAEAKGKYDRFEAALRQECGAWRLLQQPDFGGAIKGKRNVASIRDALETTLANAKIAAEESARTIRAALAALDEESKGYEHLFADRLTFIGMIPEAVRLMVRDRIAKHKEAEERRAAELAERERARIRAEEEARAAAKVRHEQEEREEAERHRLEQEASDRRLAEAEEREQRRQAEMAGAVLQQRAQEAAAPAPAANVLPMPTKAPAPATTAPTLRLGQINERLGFTVTADFLAGIGFPVVATDKAAKLWHEHQFHAICAAIAQHVVAVANGKREAA
jgi:predicted phage-related endonuclease